MPSRFGVSRALLAHLEPDEPGRSAYRVCARLAQNPVAYALLLCGGNSIAAIEALLPHQSEPRPSR